jgi:hypothetical protein
VADEIGNGKVKVDKAARVVALAATVAVAEVVPAVHDVDATAKPTL